MPKQQAVEEISVDTGKLKAGVSLRAGHKVVVVVSDLAGTPTPGKPPPEHAAPPHSAPAKPPHHAEHAHRPEHGHDHHPPHEPQHHPSHQHHHEPPKPAHHHEPPKPQHHHEPPMPAHHHPAKPDHHKKKDPNAPKHPPPPQTGTVREKIVANAEWGIRNEPHIHYAETRPIPALHHPHQLPLTTDCSGFATLCYKWAGAPDPNGNGYDGQGYTGTMLSHMRHVPPHEVEPGDLVVFGAAPGHHVAIALDKGGHWLASHGSEGGPLRIRFADEHAAQKSYGASQVTWLSVLPR